MSLLVQEALSNAMVELFEGSTSPEIDAEVLLSHCLKQSRAWLLAYQDEELDEQQVAEYQQLIQRRKKGEPIAYILGNREFWSLSLEVNSSTLIPRPETEILVEVALEKAQELNIESVKLSDLGTGSGAIALALASELPQAQITAVDASQDALIVAERNAQNNALSNVDFLHSNWFSALEGMQFDIICSNPPYIESADPHLQQGDLRFEPQSALASGIDGFYDLQTIIKHADAHLNENGWLILEHGFQQSKRTQQLLESAGFSNIDTREDYAGHPRITYGQKLAKIA